MKDKLNKGFNKDIFPVEDASYEELKAINKAKKEFQNDEFYTHMDVFGEDDYV